jgi:cytochrome c-type biogenesis protein CcmE
VRFIGRIAARFPHWSVAMLKITLFATAALATLAAVAPVQAGERHRDEGRHAAAQASAPQPITDVLKAGGGTVSGTVQSVAATWFAVNDGRDVIAVDNRGLLPEGIETGAPITVVGGVHQGAIHAAQIIRDDGSSFGRDVLRGRGDRKHDDD